MKISPAVKLLIISVLAISVSSLTRLTLLPVAHSHRQLQQAVPLEGTWFELAKTAAWASSACATTTYSVRGFNWSGQPFQVLAQCQVPGRETLRQMTQATCASSECSTIAYQGENLRLTYNYQHKLMFVQRGDQALAIGRSPAVHRDALAAAFKASLPALAQTTSIVASQPAVRSGTN